MEKRLGSIAIVITDKESIVDVNQLLSSSSDIIIARQGLPIPQRDVSFISLVVDGTTDAINKLTGKLGRLPGVEVKTIVTKNSNQEL